MIDLELMIDQIVKNLRENGMILVKHELQKRKKRENKTDYLAAQALEDEENIVNSNRSEE